MPVYPGASELTMAIRKAGAELWITTTRPYLKMDTQSPNTRHWLRRNHIQFDHMLSGEHKYRELAKSVGKDNVAVVLDDLPEMLIQAYNVGLYSILRDQPYNRHYQHGYRVKNMFDAFEAIDWHINEWRRVNGKAN
jgi:hypothetical protein